MVDFGNPSPWRSAASIAGRLDAGHILFRRWMGCWVDFIVLALLVFVPALAVPKTLFAEWFGLWMVPAVLYFPVSEGLWGRTLGKLATGLVVVDLKGNPPGAFRAVVRTLFRLIEVNPFLLGGLPAGVVVLISKHRRRLGDLAAGTYVIHAADARHIRAEVAKLENSTIVAGP